MNTTRTLLLCLFLMFSMSACLVSESKYEKLAQERDALEKKLEAMKSENKVLNDAVLEIYKEREAIQAQVQEYQQKLEEIKLARVKQQEARIKEVKKKTPQYYRVRPGDTLLHIAKKTKVPVDTIRSLNTLRNDVVWVGQKLRIE